MGCTRLKSSYGEKDLLSPVCFFCRTPKIFLANRIVYYLLLQNLPYSFLCLQLIRTIFEVFFFTPVGKTFLESKLVSKYYLKLLFSLNFSYCINCALCHIIFVFGAVTFVTFTFD